MNKMNSGMTSTVAGITVAMIAGTAAYMMSDRSHSMQRQAKKAPPRGQPCGKKRRSRD